MGAAPSHEEVGDDVADPGDSDEDDIIKIPHNRYAVSLTNNIVYHIPNCRIGKYSICMVRLR